MLYPSTKGMPMIAIISMVFKVSGEDDALLIVRLSAGSFNAGTILGKMEMAPIAIKPTMDRHEAVKAFPA